MPVSRGVFNVILSIVGIVVLICAIFLIASVLGTNAPVKPIITKNIELRNATDPLARAKLITDIDNLVAQTQNDKLDAQWQRMMQCLPTKCPDDAYLDMILLTIANYEQDIPESALLINIMAATKYWGDPDHILEFSKALSSANDQLDQLKNKNVRKYWQPIVDCNGVCPEKNDLTFDLIKKVVS